MKAASDEWVIVRIVTDVTGHPTVSVVGELFRGDTAEEECRTTTQRLNSTSRSDLMEVYLARQVGVETDNEM
jgi:hypothetical protein